MSRTKMTQIDGEKLQRLLEVAGVTPREASHAMGYAGDYFRDCIRGGRISANAVKSLERFYKILPEDYMITQATEPEQAEEKTEVPEADLKQIIEEAVLEALKRWKGEEIVAAMEKWREETRA